MKIFFPNTEEGWSYQKGGMVGRAAAIHLHNSHAGGKGKAKNIYEIIIEAEHTKPDQPTQYWGRLSTDPNTSVLFTSDELAANAVQAHEQLAKAKRKPVFYRRYSTTTNPRLNIDQTEGDFSTSSEISETWMSSLQNLQTIVGNNDYTALQGGIKISSTKMYDSTETRVRRCFATLVENRTKHPIIPLLMDLYWGMILAPKKRSTGYSFNNTVNERCKLFEEGKWAELYKNITFESKNTPNEDTGERRGG